MSLKVLFSHFLILTAQFELEGIDRIYDLTSKRSFLIRQSERAKICEKSTNLCRVDKTNPVVVYGDSLIAPGKS